MKTLRILKVLAIFAVFSILTGIYLYYSSIQDSARKKIERTNHTYALITKNHVDSLLAKNFESVRALASLEAIIAAIENPGKATIEEANTILDNFREAFSVSVCYLIDAKGIAIASSNRNYPSSFVGKDFSSLPYFKRAIICPQAVYMAVWGTSSERYIYVGYPVYIQKSEEPKGVAVIRLNIDRIEKYLPANIKGIWLLTAPNGVIFASNHSEWINDLLWKVSESDISKIAETKQFGEGPWEWTGLEPTEDTNQMRDKSGRTFFFTTIQTDNYPGWNIVFLTPIESAFESFTALFTEKNGFIILLLCLLTVSFIFFLFIKANQEISAKKKLEEELTESERKLTTLMDNLPGMAYRCANDKDWTSLFVSKGCVRLTGYQPQDLIGNNKIAYNDIIHPDDRKNVWDDVQLYVSAKKRYQLVYRIITALGDTKWVHEQGEGVYSPEGNLIFLEGFISDITKRREADEAIQKAKEVAEAANEELAENERKLSTLMDNLPGMAYRCANDKDWTMLFVSKGALRLTGYQPNDFIGNNKIAFNNIIYPDDRKNVWDDVQLYISAKKRYQIVYRIVTALGDTKWVHEQGEGVYSPEGDLIFLEGFISDITKRREADEAIKKAKEAAEAANTAKSEFLANMSHEIRTPLNGVIGFTDMLLDSSLTEDQVDLAGMIKKSGEALLALVNQILDFSKIEAGELDIEEIDFDPELIAYDVCELIKPKIGIKPVEILCHIGDNLHSQVKGDPLRFRQVLTNLMGNAPKFTESGEIELSLDIEEEKDQLIKLHATIRDTGIGIPEDKLSVIFEPFRQADGSVTRKYGGTGLGLSICKKISNLMGGDVWVESEAGKGSVFHFTAWFKKSDAKRAKRVSPVSLSGRKALLLDDNHANLDILKHVIESAGMQVVALMNGNEVLSVLEKAIESKSPFDLLLSDIQMPGMSGYEVARKIRDAGEMFSDLSVIALSSLVERDAKKCEASGFDGFLSKPIRSDKLFQMIERVMAIRKGKKSEDSTKDRKIMTQYSLKEELKISARILLVEDNPVNQKLAGMMLGKAGYHVEIAGNGLEAVEKYTAFPDDFDLIFMDVQMPVMDGMEATREIRKKGFKDIPIVAMTAHAIKGYRDECLKAGMNDYVTKPIKRELVFEMLEKYFFSKKK